MSFHSSQNISLELLESVLDAFDVAVVCTGAHNENLWINQRAQTLLNAPENQVQPLEWPNFIAPGCRKSYVKRLEQFSEEDFGKSDRSIQFECLGVNRKKKIFPAHIQIKKLYFQTDWVAVHFIRELNPEVDSFSLSLDALNNPLDGKALQDFSYILSHQSNDPLRKILSFSERLDHGYREQLGSKGQKYLECMGKAVKKFQTLVDDLRVFSRISSRPGEMSLVSLKDILEEVISDYEKALTHSKGKIIFKDLPVIMAIPKQMKILFKQLISNSLKFSSKGRPPEITVKSRAKGPHLTEITIQDNGIGFNNEHAERIFAPCERLHGNAEYPGSGMGLAICRKIAERHIGSISCAGTPGKGATFTLLIPTRHISPEVANRSH